MGAKDKKAAAQAYEYVFEDQIDFITDMALAGDVVRQSDSCLGAHAGGTMHALVADLQQTGAGPASCL